MGTSWGDNPVGKHWQVTADDFCAVTTGPVAPWSHRCLLLLNEGREGALSMSLKVWEKINATARLRKAVVVINESPGEQHLSQEYYRYHTTNDVTYTELFIFLAGTISFGHAAGWNDYADRTGTSDKTTRESTRHSHTSSVDM